MHTYLVNNKTVTKAEWQKAFKDNPDSRVVLRVETLTHLENRLITGDVITPEKAKEIRNHYKKV